MSARARIFRRISLRILGPAGLALLAGAVGLGVPAPARAEAEDADAVAKVTKLNKKATDEYENLNFDEARKILESTLELCSQSGLDRHPAKARTHLNLGVVLLSGFKQRDAAIKQFRKALEIQPDIKVAKNLANPEVQEAFEAAVPEAQPPPAAKELTHKPVAAAPQGKAIPIEVGVDPALGADKVLLVYRPQGAAEFTVREMKEIVPGTYSGEIPSSATSGGRVAYYVEAQKEGRALAARGSAAGPMTVELTGGAAVKPPAGAGAGDGGGDDDDDDDDDEARKFYIAIMGGSGVGWTTGPGEVNKAHETKPPGFAPATLGQLAPEVGYFITPALLVSVQGRLQLVSGVTEQPVCAGGTPCAAPPKYALAGFAKVTWFLSSQQVRPFVSVAAGGGAIRHVTEFKSDKKCGAAGNVTCVESIAAGAVFVGPGGGIAYQLTPAFGIVLGVNTQLGFPKFTFNIDVNAGAALSF